MRRRAVPLLLAFAGYVVVAVAFSWPLPLHLTRALTGPPSGDTGVYVWNLWVFWHELIEEKAFPLLTTTILGFGEPANLSQHNFTVGADIMALPLMALAGQVGAFNVIYLLQHVLAAFAGFLLARRVTGRAAAAWLGGLAFGFSPVLVARGTGHFSLVAAAPLAVFAWLLLRIEERGTRWTAAGLGLTVAWAAVSDPYYAIYCALIGAFHLSTRVIHAKPRVPGRHARSLAWVLNGVIVGIAALIGWIGMTGGATFTMFGGPLSVTGLQNPVQALTVAVLARLWVARRHAFHLALTDRARRLLRAVPVAGLTCAAALSPVLIALGMRMTGGKLVEPSIFWRSSPPGVDLGAWLLPNPNHVLWRDAPWTGWLARLPGGFIENVASMPLVWLLAAGVAVVWAKWRPRRYWIAFTALFGLLSLGPFVRVAGIETFVPTPWALLRYVPVIEWARSPGRFAVVAMLGLSVLFAAAVVALCDRWPRWHRVVIGIAGAALALELMPAPRPLFEAAITPIYETVAADPRPIRIIEFPFGIRDGVSSAGDFTAWNQFHQTFHRKHLLGGYLSRVSPGRVERARRHPVLSVLVDLSEGHSVSDERLAAARAAAPLFLDRFAIGYVVVDRQRASTDAIRTLVDLFDLVQVKVGARRTLYTPPTPGSAGV